MFFKQKSLFKGSLPDNDLGIHIQNFSVRWCQNLLHFAENLPLLKYHNMNAAFHCKLKNQWSIFATVTALLSWQDDTLSHKPIRLEHLKEYNNFYRLQHWRSSTTHLQKHSWTQKRGRMVSTSEISCPIILSHSSLSTHNVSPWLHMHN
jgi:hypothetical protein